MAETMKKRQQIFVVKQSDAIKWQHVVEKSVFEKYVLRRTPGMMQIKQTGQRQCHGRTQR